MTDLPQFNRLVLVLVCLVLSSVAHADDDDQISALLRDAIEEGQMAGAVVMMSRRGELVYSNAIGDAQVAPQSRPMQLDTVFDLASLTKPVATATSVMVLVDQGKLQVNTTIASVFPEFAAEGKQSITVEDLLLHRGGLIADNALSDYGKDQQQNWANICRLQPLAKPGERFVYSDVGFIVLGRVVEQVSGQDFDAFTQKHLFEPLQMTDTSFNPPPKRQQRAAATERQNGKWLVGQVHDPRAARMNGVAGHAGLFSTAADLIRFGQALCRDGATPKAQFLSKETIALMTHPRQVPRGKRAYGWDILSPYSSNRANGYSDAAFGHGGFTGTVLWIDPKQQIVFVFLSNRLHPDGKGSVNRLAARVADQLLP